MRISSTPSREERDFANPQPAGDKQPIPRHCVWDLLAKGKIPQFRRAERATLPTCGCPEGGEDGACNSFPFGEGWDGVNNSLVAEIYPIGASNHTYKTFPSASFTGTFTPQSRSRVMARG